MNWALEGPRDAMLARYMRIRRRCVFVCVFVCLSVCPSVTRRYFVTISKLMIDHTNNAKDLSEIRTGSPQLGAKSGEWVKIGHF